MPNFDIKPLPGYPNEYGLLLAALQDSTNEWRGELGVPDLQTVTWQPYPGGSSIGSQLLHIGAVELSWVQQFCLGEKLDPETRRKFMADETDVDEGIWPTPPAEPIAYYFELLDGVRARTLESVKRFAAPETAMDHHDGTKTLRWVLSHIVQHDSYHGGQAVMLGLLANKISSVKQVTS